MRARRTRVVLGLAAALWLGSVPGATADQPDALGWWWAGRPSETFPAQFAPVPSVPEGGFYVAGGPGGPSGVSALRFELDDDVVGAVLTLAVAETVGTPLIDLCPAAQSWKPAKGGAWDQRAVADCGGGRLRATPPAGGSTITFDLASLPLDGTLDIVLLPGADSSGQPTFSTSFKRPTATTLVVQRRSVEDASTTEADSSLPPPSAEETTAGPEPAPSPAPEAVPLAEQPEAPASESVASAPQARAAPIAATIPDGFAYPIILVLPLVLLVLGSYLAWVLTRPIVARVGARR